MSNRVMSKEELLELGKLKTEAVEVNGKEVLVSEIAAADYQKIWQECSIPDGVDEKGADKQTVDMEKFNVLLLIYCLVDADGNRIFADEDAPLFSRYAQAPFAKMTLVAKRLNGMLADEKNDSEPTKTGLNSGE